MISSQDLCWYTNVNRIIKARMPVMWTRNIEVHNQAPSFDFLLFLIQIAIQSQKCNVRNSFSVMSATQTLHYRSCARAL